MRSNIKDNKGFTIIEVMIVLAIAGLIMLIVFLAVPALQRNSRNTQIKNDASAIAAAFSDYQGVNNGASPTGGTISGGTVNLTGTGTATSGKINGSTTGTIGTAAAMPTTTGVINVKTGSRCNAAGNGVGTASTRAAAILFLQETSGTDAQTCVDA